MRILMLFRKEAKVNCTDFEICGHDHPFTGRRTRQKPYLLYLAPQNLIGPSALPGLVPPNWAVYNDSWSSEINE